MAWLHEDQNTFRDAVYFSANQNNVTPAVVEKDYFVTMILHGLANRLPFIVFKGGTSLSKCHKVIRRFSEDIDVTIDTKISQGQMAKVKDAIRDVAASLGLTICTPGEPAIQPSRMIKTGLPHILVRQPPFIFHSFPNSSIVSRSSALFFFL